MRLLMSKLIVADPNGTASRLSAEAGLALVRGNTALAARKHDEAGQILEMRMNAVGRAREKHYLRFLAATQFYKGGHYQHAAELAEKIDPKLLDARARELLPPFLKDVRERSSPGYPGRMKAKMDTLWAAHDWKGVLDLLAEHQYVMTPGGSAWARGICLRELGELKASAIFFAQAIRHRETVVPTIRHACCSVLELAISPDRDAAERFAMWLTDHMPNAASHAALAFARYAKLVHAPEHERAEIVREQISAMDNAVAGAEELLASVANDPLVRRLLLIAAGATALVCRWAGDDERATRFRQLAVRLDEENEIDFAAWFRHWDRMHELATPLADEIIRAAEREAASAKAPEPDFVVAA